MLAMDELQFLVNLEDEGLRLYKKGLTLRVNAYPPALENQRFPVLVRLLTMCGGELFAELTQLMLKCL